MFHYQCPIDVPNCYDSYLLSQCNHKSIHMAMCLLGCSLDNLEKYNQNKHKLGYALNSTNHNI